MIPRILGKVGQGAEGPHEGKWFASIWITSLGGGIPTSDEDAPDYQLGPFETEVEAKKHLMELAKIASQTIELAMTGKKSGSYLDMKDNVIKNWSGHAKEKNRH